jgi:subfamily B ATP-binding cassette protein MsbA
MRNLWRFMAFTRPYWPWVVIGSVTGLVRMVPQLYLPPLMKSIIDKVVTAPGALEARLAVGWHMLLPFAVWMLTVHIVASTGRLYWSQFAATSAIRDIRFQLYDHLQRLSLAFHTQRPSGSIVSRVMTDVNSAQYIFDLVFIQAFQVTFISLVVCTMLFLRDWQWALVALGTVPLYLVTTRLVSRPMRQASRQTLETMSTMSGYLAERMSMIREVQAFTAETREKRTVRREVEQLKRYALRQHFLNAMLISASEITRFLGQVAVVFFGAWRVISGHGATVGDILLFYSYTGTLYNAFDFFANFNMQYQQAAAGADRVFEFFDTDRSIADAPGAKRLNAHRPPAVAFDHVRFSYPTDDPTVVLDDITLDVQPGWRVVLVGESGAGKSTLMNVLPRFYDVQGGRITIDGQDIRSVTVRSLRRAIGIVPQEPALFTGTIWENILYGRRDAPEEEVRAAARAANAEEFIQELPNGYETIVGERGVGLSGGQIQRIAIARAFLKDPKILIMDEATSNLDAVSEALVLQALDRLAQGRTTFIIAHRLSVAREADLVVVLDRGRITETGTHADLLARGGLYAELWERQMIGTAP